jgi:O-antigen/teichoic acid export membrane protein
VINKESKCSWREILKFYLPLFLNQGVITLTAPFLNYGVSRSCEPERSLAAFAASFSLTIIINAVIITSLKVYNSHLKDRQSLQKILAFFLLLGVAGTGTSIFIAVTPAGDYIFINLLRVQKETAIHSKDWMLWSSLIPILISFRCALQGLTTVNRRTINTAIATSLRMASALCLIILLVMLFPCRPGMAAGVAYTGAILIETLFLFVRTREMLRFTSPIPVNGCNFALSYRYILKFTLPLWVSSLAWTSSFSLINLFIAQTLNNEAGLAGFSIIRSLSVFLSSPLFSLITLILIMGNNQTLKRIRQFIMVLVFMLTLAVLILVCTDLKSVILSGFFNLSGVALVWSEQALNILFFFPILLGIRCYFEGLFLREKKPTPIGLSGIARLIVLLVSGVFINKYYSGLNGAQVGTVLMFATYMSDMICMVSAYFILSLKKRR